MAQNDRITPSVQRMLNELAKLPQEAYGVFKNNTPKDTGNARSKTKLRGDTIYADYPYAQRLDKGWSRQSPQGMTTPTTKFIQQRLSRIIRK